MRLTISTPTRLVLATAGVTALRAEDDSGAFGIRAGHADLTTVLATSVVQWTERNGISRYAAVRGGVLSVTAGAHIDVATPEAVLGDDLATLERAALGHMRAAAREASAARRAQAGLEARAARLLFDYVSAGRRRGWGAST